MKKTSAAATRRKKSRGRHPGKHRPDVYNAFLDTSGEISPANRLPADSSSWIPDAMELAKLAATLFPDSCKDYRVEYAIRDAWAVFVRSQAFCLELKALPPKKRAARLAKLNEAKVPPFVQDLVGKSSGATRMYRFDPSSDEQDEVRSFFGVKGARAMMDILDDYSRACTPDADLHVISHRLLLDAARGMNDKGKEVYEFPKELLEDIKQYRIDRKHRGGVKAWEKRKSHSQDAKRGNQAAWVKPSESGKFSSPPATTG